MTDIAPATRARVLEGLRDQRIETPSWAYGNSGTRFKVFAQEGVPRTPREKIDDAATVHRFTGVAPSVTLHIPWDAVDDYAALARYAADAGVSVGTINANVFQDDDMAVLLRTGKLGGFDFNSRFYADDDLMVGSADPFQLFRIMHEVVRGGGYAPRAGVAFMLDQCHNIEPKIPGQIRSVLNVQEATAKALLVDADALAAAQGEGDILGANAVLMDAYNTDVRPLLADLRADMGLDPDPMAAYAASGHAERIKAERVGGQQAGWGA